MANVGYMVPELALMRGQYELISDCVAGAEAVKGRGSKYLPQPNPSDNSAENRDRYDAYKTRAVFYNVTRHTLNGLTGQIFSREPEIVLPGNLGPLLKDANGTGVGLTQLAKQAARTVISHGRAGLHTDYPDFPAGVSRADLDAGRARPTINYYKPLDIINWRVTTVGARDLLTLVVLKETFILADDGFEQKKETRYRVLRLVNGIYTVEVYNNSNLNQPAQSYVPTDAAGGWFNEIPFTFIGVDNNDPSIDEPPMYDLADLNIAHYRNSADLEESCFIVGQPTPWFSGLTEDWVNDVFEGKTIELGSRAAVPLPSGAQAGLLQASENSLVGAQMEHKERQMVALGAKLVESTTVQRTATEAKLESSTETSQLKSTSENVSAAFTFALEMAARFAGSAGKPTLTLNTEFELNTLSPEEQKQVIATWQAGGISFTEMRTRMRFSGLATQTDAVARAEIATEMAAMGPDRQTVENDISGGA